MEGLLSTGPTSSNLKIITKSLLNLFPAVCTELYGVVRGCVTATSLESCVLLPVDKVGMYQFLVGVPGHGC